MCTRQEKEITKFVGNDSRGTLFVTIQKSQQNTYKHTKLNVY